MCTVNSFNHWVPQKPSTPVKTRWHHNAAPKPMPGRIQNMTLSAPPICAQWKQCDPLGILFNNVERTLCIAVVTAVALAHRSLIKTESRTAKIRQVDSHCQGFTGKWTSEWMNTNLYSFALCQFVLSWFFLSKWSAFEKKILQHDFAWCLSIPCWLSSFKVLEPERKFKQNSNISYIFVKSFWISLPINTKKNLRGNTFFLRSILRYSFWSSSWSSTVKIPFIFIDLCRFSRVDVPPSGPENVPKPRLPPYESPLSAVSSTCKEKSGFTWDKCYGSVRLALFTASLTKTCVVWNRTN